MIEKNLCKTIKTFKLTSEKSWYEHIIHEVVINERQSTKSYGYITIFSQMYVDSLTLHMSSCVVLRMNLQQQQKTDRKE